MKLHVTAAAAVCLVMLLVASEMVITSEAASCSIFQLVPCMAASKNAKAVTPSKLCCTNIANMGKGFPWSQVLVLFAEPFPAQVEWKGVEYCPCQSPEMPHCCSQGVRLPRIRVPGS